MTVRVPDAMRADAERAFALRLDRLIEEAEACVVIAEKELGRAPLAYALVRVVTSARYAASFIRRPR